LLELVAKLPASLEEVTTLRKKFSKKTTECLNEILSMIGRAIARIKEEERAGPKPAVIRVQRPENSLAKSYNFAINELKADDLISDLAIELNNMSFTVDESRLVTIKPPAKPPKSLQKPAEGVKSDDLFSFKSQSGSKLKKKKLTTGFSYASFSDYLRQLYPSVNITPTKKIEGKISNELTDQNTTSMPEKIETEEFIGIKDKTKTLVIDQGEDEDIMDKVSHSLLPASLKEKFKVDLLKIKKKDFTNKVIEQKKGTKPNNLQSTSREIFEKGNVFEVLKSKDVDQLTDNEGRFRITLEDEDEVEEPKQKNFWDCYNEANKKHLASHNDVQAKVGEFGASTKTKKKKDKHKKAQFSQPSIRSAMKF
jgi:hypothetical protein